MTRIFFRAPGRTLTISVILWWTNLAMAPLSILLAVRELADSYATAGLAAGCYGIGHALLAPLRGRLTDRFGLRVIFYCGLVCAVGFTGVALSVAFSLSPAVALASCAVAGLGSPPVVGTARALWGSMLKGRSLRQAYASIVISGDVTHALGPLAVTALIVIASPALALAICAVLTIFAVSSLLRGASGLVKENPKDSKERSPFGAILRSRTFQVLMAIDLALGFGIGSIDVAVPAFAGDNGGISQAGILLGAFAFGSATVGLLFAKLNKKSGVGRYPIFISAVAFAYCLPLMATSNSQMFIALLVAGGASAPATIALFEAIDHVAHRSQAVEAFTWIATAFTAGVAGGATLSGLFVEHFSVTMAFSVGLIAALAGATVAVTCRRVFQGTAHGSSVNS